MAKSRTDTRPIQVFLETQRFIEMEEPRNGPRGSKDFFAGNDRGFIAHKQRIQSRVKSVAEAMRRSGGPAGFVRVRQRDEALAKSHRPLGSLFTEANSFALVGVDGIGEMLFQAIPGGLDRLSAIIQNKAEETPARKPERGTERLVERPTRYRTELGGISDVQLYATEDKLKFSASDAVAWFASDSVIGGYIVELFRPDRKVGGSSINVLIDRLRESIEGIPGGMLVRPFLPASQTTQYGEPTLTVQVQLFTGSVRQIELPFLEDGRPAEISEMSLRADTRASRPDHAVDRHALLLNALAAQPLVRSINLPPTLETFPVETSARSFPMEVIGPAAKADYPVVAVVDGGVSKLPALVPWTVGDAGLVPPSDRDENHGTFIAGLICAGHTLNPALAEQIEPVGCKIYDLDLFPKRELRSRYYPDIEDLFDTLDTKVRVAKDVFGVRVFNLSFQIGARSSRLAYSLTADRLDRIARENDVLFVVSSGNLPQNGCRPPWPAKPQDVLTMLAATNGYNQQITAPSDHLLGLTVGAVNPAGVPGHAAGMPTTYTRRGPGVGGAPKPDLAQVGGAGVPAHLTTGLASLTTAGTVTDNCGTSFASPLTAASLSTLDQRLQRQAPRETLLALSLHRAKRPDAFDTPALRRFAREFVGFGFSPTADEMLNDAPHTVTLVFHGVLLRKQRLEFAFAWPKSLVAADGACRGKADVTLVYTPPIDPDHREEAVRIQLEAHLHQGHVDDSTGELTWQSRLKHDGTEAAQGSGKTESTLIRTGLKWSPTKRYNAVMKKGRGNTSNWKVSIESLERALSTFPAEGVSFTLLLTISDLNETAQVREEMRTSLLALGVKLADITVAHRIRT